MAQITVYVPRLFAARAMRSDGAIDVRRWPALHALLSRARTAGLASASAERRLLDLSGLSRSSVEGASTAALTASIDFDAMPAVDLVRADPVHVRADPHQLLLFNDPAIMPSVVEADSLIKDLNAALPELRFFRGRHPARWYFEFPLDRDTVTHSPGRVSGRSIAAYMPRGVDERRLAQLINDVQIVLHHASVNHERETDGRPPINSIWPWDATISPESDGATDPAPDLVAGDDVLAMAVAQRLSVPWCATTEPSDVLRLTADRRHRNVLVVLGAPNGQIDAATAVTNIDPDDFERRWCMALTDALRRSRIKRLRLITETRSYVVSAWDMLKIWRRLPGLKSDEL